MLFPSGESILWASKKDNFDCHFSNMIIETLLKLIGSFGIVFRVWLLHPQYIMYTVFNKLNRLITAT